MEPTLQIQRLAAFCKDGVGGNPAGVVLVGALPAPEEMQRIAAAIGYSETAFAAKTTNGWRVRYFSPQNEVPFCGHATIALGAVLAQQFGDGVFDLILNSTAISVEGSQSQGVPNATLQSPPTWSKPAASGLISEVLALFGYNHAHLNPEIPPAVIHAGASHFVLAVTSREALSAMRYDLKAGRNLMLREQWLTILLIYANGTQTFHCRNAFASGGVYEDPATGSAAAAFAGYLREINWAHNGRIELYQGQDMGMPSHIVAAISAEPGAPINISGRVRFIQP